MFSFMIGLIQLGIGGILMGIGWWLGLRPSRIQTYRKSALKIEEHASFRGQESIVREQVSTT